MREYLNVMEASEYASVSEVYLRKLLLDGVIPSRKRKNGHYEIDKADLDAWNAQRNPKRKRVPVAA